MKRHSPLVFGFFCVLHALTSSVQAVEASPAAEHVVSPGDSLDKIARTHGCRVADLMAANGLKADALIFPGQKIKIPSPGPAAEEASSPNITATSSPESGTDSHAATDGNSEAKHTIAAGETFASIARQHGIPVADLIAANPDIKPTAMRPGQTIRLVRTTESTEPSSLATGDTQLVLATKQNPSLPEPFVSPPAVKIQSIRIDRQMTYLEFASRQGTNTRRLNQLNGLDLLDSALLARGTELLAPAQP